MTDTAQKAVSIIEVAMPIIFLVWLLLFVVMGLILRYHWRRYGIEQVKSSKITIIYFSIGGLFILGMLILYITFTLQTHA